MGLLGDIGKGLLGVNETKTENEFSGSSTQQTELRDFTPDEQSIYDQGVRGLLESGESLTPEALAKLKQDIYDRGYNLASTNINQSYANTSARDYANAASRGAGNTSAGGARADTNRALQGRELGLASDRAFLNAEDAAIREQANRRATAGTYMNQLSNIWNRQLQGSKVVNTSKGTSSGTTTSLPTIGNSLAQGLGNYAQGSDSEFLSRIFGG